MSNGKEPIDKLAGDVIAADSAKAASRPGKTQPATTARQGRVSQLPRRWLAPAAVLAVVILAAGSFLAVRAIQGGGQSNPASAPSAVMYEQLNSSAVSKLDPSTCNMNLDYVWKIIGDAAPLEGKTATATATGPGLQHTYTTTVKGGQMEFKATSPGSAWSTGPGNGCSSTSGQGWELKLATVGNLHAADGILR